MSAWKPMRTAPCDDRLAFVYWNRPQLNGFIHDPCMTYEDLDHDSDPHWWMARGALAWAPFPEPYENAVYESY